MLTKVNQPYGKHDWPSMWREATYTVIVTAFVSAAATASVLIWAFDSQIKSSKQTAELAQKNADSTIALTTLSGKNSEYEVKTAKEKQVEAETKLREIQAKLQEAESAIATLKASNQQLLDDRIPRNDHEKLRAEYAALKALADKARTTKARSAAARQDSEPVSPPQEPVKAVITHMYRNGAQYFSMIKSSLRMSDGDLRIYLQELFDQGLAQTGDNSFSSDYWRLSTKGLAYAKANGLD